MPYWLQFLSYTGIIVIYCVLHCIWNGIREEGSTSVELMFVPLPAVLMVGVAAIIDSVLHPWGSWFVCTAAVVGLLVAAGWFMIDYARIRRRRRCRLTSGCS